MSSTRAMTPLAQRDLKYHLHPQTELARHEEQGPHILERGDGIYVTDIEGKRYIEGMAGLWCASLGFSERRLAEAAYRQLLTLPCYHNFAHKTSPSVANLAEKLIRIAPEPMSRVFFTSSGSEANDTVVRLVRYFNNIRGRRDKKKIISRHGGYHGMTVAAASLTGLPYAHKFFDAPIAGILYTDCPHHYRLSHAGESEEAIATRLADSLEALIRREGAETIAAFVAEPVMAAGGVIPPPNTYFEKVQVVLRRYDILFVADEVVCGFGRTGDMFGCGKYGIRPDVVVVAKALSSGYVPIGAVMVTEEIYRTLVEGSKQVGTFGAGFTYSGHPVACAVALETLKIYEERDIVARVRELTLGFLDRLHSFRSHPFVGETRGVGLIGAIEFVEDKDSRKSFAGSRRIGPQLAELALAEGLIVRPLRNDSIAFCPPLTITPSEIKEMFDRFARALGKAKF